jgi:hypothetical protein
VRAIATGAYGAGGEKFGGFVDQVLHLDRFPPGIPSGVPGGARVVAKVGSGRFQFHNGLVATAEVVIGHRPKATIPGVFAKPICSVKLDERLLVVASPAKGCPEHAFVSDVAGGERLRKVDERFRVVEYVGNADAAIDRRTDDSPLVRGMEPVEHPSTCITVVLDTTLRPPGHGQGIVETRLTGDASTHHGKPVLEGRGGGVPVAELRMNLPQRLMRVVIGR